MNTSPWRSIFALNAVSTLSQIGQFGIGFIVLPVWLAQLGINAAQAGVLAAVQWAGMLLALVLAPKCISRMGARNTVLTALLLSAVAFALIAQTVWPFWLLAGALIGMGVGLRWIANETWLFSLTPQHASGKVVGAHESLIALAGVIAPILPLWLAIHDAQILWIGIAFTVLAALPLFLATPYAAEETIRTDSNIPNNAPQNLSNLMLLGLIASVAGGLADGALYGLFPLFTKQQGFSTEQTTWLLVIFGLGAVAFQYPIGWSIDRFGLEKIMLSCALLAMLTSLSLIVAKASWMWVEFNVLILGGVNSAFLTLGVFAAASSERLKMTHHMRLISIAFTLSSIVGPLIAGLVMNQLGGQMLMWQMALVSFIVLLCVIRNSWMRHRSHAA